MVRHWRDFKEADSSSQRNVSTHNLMALLENHVERSREGDGHDLRRGLTGAEKSK